MQLPASSTELAKKVLTCPTVNCNLYVSSWADGTKCFDFSLFMSRVASTCLVYWPRDCLILCEEAVGRHCCQLDPFAANLFMGQVLLLLLPLLLFTFVLCCQCLQLSGQQTMGIINSSDSQRGLPHCSPLLSSALHCIMYLLLLLCICI